MKEKLLQLVEAYAAARSTGNGTLISYAVAELNAFLQAVEIKEIVQEQVTEE